MNAFFKKQSEKLNVKSEMNGTTVIDRKGEALTRQSRVVNSTFHFLNSTLQLKEVL